MLNGPELSKSINTFIVTQAISVSTRARTSLIWMLIPWSQLNASCQLCITALYLQIERELWFCQQVCKILSYSWVWTDGEKIASRYLNDEDFKLTYTSSNRWQYNWKYHIWVSLLTTWTIRPLIYRSLSRENNHCFLRFLPRSKLISNPQKFSCRSKTCLLIQEWNTSKHAHNLGEIRTQKRILQKHEHTWHNLH